MSAFPFRPSHHPLHLPRPRYWPAIGGGVAALGFLLAWSDAAAKVAARRRPCSDRRPGGDELQRRRSLSGAGPGPCRLGGDRRGGRRRSGGGRAPARRSRLRPVARPASYDYTPGPWNLGEAGAFVFARSHSHSPGAAGSLMTIPTVLLVEDDSIILMVLEDFLAEAGFTVTAAIDGTRPWACWNSPPTVSAPC